MADFRLKPEVRGARILPDRRWLLTVLGMLFMALSHPLLWQADGIEMLFAPLGVGLALTAWLGYRVVLPLGAVLLVVQLCFRHADTSMAQATGIALLTSAEIAAAWWYYRKAGGTRRLDDPRSTTLFLLVVAGLFVGMGAVLQAFIEAKHFLGQPPLHEQAVSLWMGHVLGVVAVAPPLLAVLTPWLVHYRLCFADPTEPRFVVHPRLSWTMGELLETVSLAVGAAILGGVLAMLHVSAPSSHWHWWGILLLLIVWASLRLGFRGGTLIAALATLATLLVASLQPGITEEVVNPLRANLLAQCTTALLIGASADWIRRSEARYRLVVGQIPVVLYSGRFLRMPGPGARPEVEICFVSPAAEEVLGCAPETLLGDFRAWLEHVNPSDRELLWAALAQLLLQRKPVTCEYRLANEDSSPEADDAAHGLVSNPMINLARQLAKTPDRHVRETLAPHYGLDGLLDGWEGVVEDITEQRQLGHDLRRTTNMLRALIAHMPMGVYFVHGENGRPMLVNARARQLLGQREEIAAALNHLSTIYRLHKTDGQPYPAQELPVYRALHHGATTMCDDVVVHRPDGRRIPLVTWAAPVDLGGQGEPKAAVWVLEDLTALRQAETARRETELRLQVIVETMAEGLIVQNSAGQIIEWNPSACEILGVAAEQLRNWSALTASGACLREDGSVMERDEQPDRVCLRSGQAVRGVVMGIQTPHAVRWILANSMLVSVSDKIGDNRGKRVVTTFADITAHRQALEVLRHSEEQYRGLVETLPLVLLQFDQHGALDYHNPATEEITGYGPEALRQTGFWQDCIHPDDAAAFRAVLDAARTGQCARAEVRYRGADGSEKIGYALGQPRQPAGATVLVVDMTQRRRLEQDLQKVDRLELVGRIASGVVHDFNNLLTVIIGYVELTREAIGQHPAACDLRRVLDAAEQAQQLAGQLLAFSKQRHVVMRPVDLGAVARHTLELLRPTMPSNIEVTETGKEEPVLVLADDSPLQQIIMNLCLNARDAMGQGGQITVETAREHLLPGNATVARATAAIAGTRNWAHLTVIDTGCGMDDAVKMRIFEPLFTTKERGTGLGLAVVKQIVDGFGGCINVTSSPGQGTRFDVWLPLKVGQ